MKQRANRERNSRLSAEVVAVTVKAVFLAVLAASLLLLRGIGAEADGCAIVCTLAVIVLILAAIFDLSFSLERRAGEVGARRDSPLAVLKRAPDKGVAGCWKGCQAKGAPTRLVKFVNIF